MGPGIQRISNQARPHQLAILFISILNHLQFVVSLIPKITFSAFAPMHIKSSHKVKVCKFLVASNIDHYLA